MSKKYFYGRRQADLFSFIRIPQLLLTEERFDNLSCEAMVLYGLLLNRMCLSAENGWFDDEGRVFVYWKVDDAAKKIKCHPKKAGKVFKELEEFELIERKRQGLTKPNLIYVLDFSDEVSDGHFQKCQNDISGNVKRTLQEVSISHSNNTENNKTEKKETDLSFLSEGDAKRPEEYERYFVDSLKYYALIQANPMDRETIDGILDLLIEICSCSASTMRIAGDDKPTAFVRKRLMKLKADHIEYVLDGLKENTTRIRDMKQYLLTALFNAPLTISPHYQSKVNYELYGVHE